MRHFLIISGHALSDWYQVMRCQLPRQSYDEGALGDLHRPGQRSHPRVDGGFVRSKGGCYLFQVENLCRTLLEKLYLLSMADELVSAWPRSVEAGSHSSLRRQKGLFLD